MIPQYQDFISYHSNPSNSQNFNRYNYVINNPLKSTDPSEYGYDYDSSQSDYDAGSASDNQHNENHRDRDGKMTVDKPIVKVTPPSKYEIQFHSRCND